jgi:hypothetical protein
MALEIYNNEADGILEKVPCEARCSSSPMMGDS